MNNHLWWYSISIFWYIKHWLLCCFIDAVFSMYVHCIRVEEMLYLLPMDCHSLVTAAVRKDQPNSRQRRDISLRSNTEHVVFFRCGLNCIFGVCATCTENIIQEKVERDGHVTRNISTWYLEMNTFPLIKKSSEEHNIVNK